MSERPSRKLLKRVSEPEVNIYSEFSRNSFYPGFIHYEHFTQSEMELLDKLSNEYAINKNELAFVMTYVHDNYRYFSFGHENMKEYSNLIKYADKILSDNPSSFKITWKGKELPNMFEYPRVFDCYKKELDRLISFFRRHPYSRLISNKKNFFIKEITYETWLFFHDMYELGPDQCLYVIGFIYAYYGIHLDRPIFTESQFEIKKENLSYKNYRDYLKGTLKSYLS